MTVDASSNVRVLVGTTEGPVDLLRLVQEKPVVRRSDVYIGSSTERAGIGRAYNEFVSTKTGLIERLFGKGAYRINVSGRIDAGSSWQLGFLVAHALKAASRLPADDQGDYETVLWTTGTIRHGDLSVGEIGYLGKKLTLSLERLLADRKAGKRILIAYPAANAAEIDAELRRSIEGTGATLVELDSVRHLLRELALPPIVMEVSAADKIWEGSPFRNLEPFESEHRDIFFGRGRAREEALERLRRSAARDIPFLLVHGRSGSGKSSLVRAGLVGDIKAQASEADVWLEAIITPQRSADAPLRTLVEVLLAKLPQISSSVNASSLLDSIRARDPLAIEVILGAIRAAGGGRDSKLILVIDQLEELLLWARDRGDTQAAKDREAFGALIAALSRTGAVWTIATLRSDLIASLDDSPALSRLAKDDSMYRLERPTRMEFREIILRPLAAARLTLDGADPSGLPFADVLIDKASASPDSLPLLQFVLSRLFELEGRTRRLTYAMYARLQGIEGAIGRLADDTVELLARDGVPGSTIDQVILNLGRYDRDLSTVTARWARIPTGSDQARIIEALAKARLLILDEGGRTRVAHEAVLTHWPRARVLFEIAARDLDLRDMIEPDAETWETQGRDRAFLMPAGRRLTEAADLSGANRVLLSQAARSFISASLEAARQAADAENLRLQAEANKERNWRRRAVAAGLILALLTVAAAWFGLDARKQAQEAAAQRAFAEAQTDRAKESARESERQKQAAETAEKKAVESAEEASLREAAARSIVEIQTNPEQGLETAIGALKTNMNSGKPVLTEVYSAAWKALDAAREVKTIRAQRPWLNNVSAIAPHPDGRRIAVTTASAVHLFDLDGRQLTAPIGDAEKIAVEGTGVAWQPNGEHFIVAQGQGQGLRLYLADGSYVRTLYNPSASTVTACIFIDDERVAAGTSDGRLTTLSIDGRIVDEKLLSEKSALGGVAKIDEIVVAAEAAPEDKQQADNTEAPAEVNNSSADTTLESAILPNLLPPGARCLVKAPGYSNLLAVCGSEGRIDLWDFSYSGKQFEHKRTIQAHAGTVNAVAFHPSGHFFATAGEDGLIRLFRLDGQSIQPPIRRTGGVQAVNALAFVDEGRRLISDCSEGLCLWDVGDISLPKSVDADIDLCSVDQLAGTFFAGNNLSDGGWKITAVSIDGKSLDVSSSSEGKLRALKPSPSSSFLVFVTQAEITMLELASRSVVWTRPFPDDGNVLLSFADQGGLLAVAVAPTTNSGDQQAVTKFLLLDGRTGEQRASVSRQGPATIADMVGIVDRSGTPSFFTVSTNGLLERWTDKLEVEKRNNSLGSTNNAPNVGQRPRLARSESGDVILAAVGSRVGRFDADLNVQRPPIDLGRAISAIAASPDSSFFATISQIGRIGGSDPKSLRVYDIKGQLVIERDIFGSFSGGAPLRFGNSNIAALEGYAGLIVWPMGPKVLLATAESRMLYYSAKRARETLEADGDLAFKERRHDDAARWFAQAIELDPMNSDKHILLGNSLTFAASSPADWEAAERAYSRGIALQPYDPIAYLQRGKARFRSGRFAEAEKDFVVGANYQRYSLPIVRQIKGFLGLNSGIRKLSLSLAKMGVSEFYLRRALANFAQKRWPEVIDGINLIQSNALIVHAWQQANWRETAGDGPRRLAPLELNYRGRAFFELARYKEAYADLKQASDLLKGGTVKYEFEDLEELSNTPGSREAKRGELLAISGEAAQRFGDMKLAVDARKEARAAYASAITTNPSMRAWRDAMDLLTP